MELQKNQAKEWINFHQDERTNSIIVEHAKFVTHQPETQHIIGPHSIRRGMAAETAETRVHSLELADQLQNINGKYGRHQETRTQRLEKILRNQH